jgi:hypothetical protein
VACTDFSCSKTISRKRDHPQLFRHRTSFNGRGHAGAYSSATRATSINQQDRLLNSCTPRDCPPGYTVIYPSSGSGAVTAGLTMPEGSKVCIIESEFHSDFGVGIEVRDPSKGKK